MRFKSKKHNEIVVRKTFALFPININGDCRWLEFVKIKGYWWEGASGTWWWEPQCFID